MTVITILLLYYVYAHAYNYIIITLYAHDVNEHACSQLFILPIQTNYGDEINSALYRNLLIVQVIHLKCSSSFGLVMVDISTGGIGKEKFPKT